MTDGERGWEGVDEVESLDENEVELDGRCWNNGDGMVRELGGGGAMCRSLCIIQQSFPLSCAFGS